MKILQVISSFPPAYSYGGPAKSVYELSKELVKKGNDVTVYTTDVLDRHHRIDVEIDPIFMDGIEVYHFHNFDGVPVHTAFDCAPGMAKALKKEMSNFDLVHLHEYRSLQSILVRHFAVKSNIPYILQPRGSLTRLGKAYQKKLFDDIAGHRVVRDASMMITSSKIEWKSYQSVFPWIKEKKVQTIPNYIDIGEYEKLPDRGIFRELHDIRPNQKIILYLSRIHRNKGADVLIRAFSKIRNQIPDTKLVIAGPDEGFLQELEELVTSLNLTEDVIFPGPLFGQIKISAFVDADVFVLPSHYESFGNVIIEAMACRTPVIITRYCGVSEWVNHIVSPIELNESDLERALVDFLTNKKLSEKLGYEGRRFVLNNFNLDDNMKEVEHCYRLLAE